MRRDKFIDNLLQQTGIDVKVNDASDTIFCDDVQTATKKFLSEHLTQDSIAAYAFSWSVETHKQAKKSGAQSVSHCPLMIRLGAYVLSLMGHKGGMYDLVAKIAGFPSSERLLCSSPDINVR